MPGWYKSIKRVSAPVDYPTVGILDRRWQGWKWNMGGQEPWLRKHGEIRKLVVGIKLVLKERDKIMRIRRKQRMVLWDWEGLPIEDSKRHGFQPCCAWFWHGDKDEVRVSGLEVLLEIDDCLNLLGWAPKLLVKIDMRSSPTSLFGKREKKFLEFITQLFLIICWLGFSGMGYGHCSGCVEEIGMRRRQ